MSGLIKFKLAVIGVGAVGIVAVLVAFFLEESKAKKKRAISKPATSIAPAPLKTAPTNVDSGKVLENVTIGEIRLHELTSLRGTFPSADIRNDARLGDPDADAVVYNKVIGEKDYIVNDVVQKKKLNGKSEAFVRAGPRELTHFDPKKVNAGTINKQVYHSLD